MGHPVLRVGLRAARLGYESADFRKDSIAFGVRA